MATLEELKKAQRNIGVTEEEQITEVDFKEGVTRAAGQGVSFGFGDEIEAVVRSALDQGLTYKEALDVARDKIESFRKTNPGWAYGSEIAGSLPTAVLGGAGLAKTAGTLGKVGLTASKAKMAVPIGASQGAVYGAGISEEGERLKGAGTGAALGAGFTAAGGYILPKTTALAKKYIKSGVLPHFFSKGGILRDKGIKLTPGQAMKGSGVLGDLYHGIEESLISFPGVGAPIKNAKTIALSDFNKIAMLEAIEPITSKETLKKLQKTLQNTHGNESYAIIDDFISTKYQDVIGKITLKGPAVKKLNGKVLMRIVNSEADDTTKKLLEKRFENLIINNIKTDAKGVQYLSGKDLKNLESVLFRDAQSFYKKGGFDYYTGETISKIRNDIKDIIKLYHPESELPNLNKAFAQFKPIGEAVLSANNAEGIFTPKQLLNALKKTDITPGKKATKLQKGIVTKIAREGQELLGDFVPDSGTASRLIAGKSVYDPKTILSYISPSFISSLLYGPGRVPTRGILNVPGMLQRGTTPAMSGLLTEPAQQKGSQLTEAIRSRF